MQTWTNCDIICLILNIMSNFLVDNHTVPPICCCYATTEPELHYFMKG